MTPEENELLKSVKELRIALYDLTRVLEKDYIKREEIERRYSTKEGSLRRYWSAILILLCVIFLAYMGSIITVSGCFLDEAPHPAACSAIPGYDDANARNDQIMKQFENMQKMLKQIHAEQRRTNRR